MKQPLKTTCVFFFIFSAILTHFRSEITISIAQKEKDKKNEKDVPSSWEGGRGENPNSIFVGKYLIYFLPT